MYDKKCKLLPTVVMTLLIKVTHNIHLGNQIRMLPGPFCRFLSLEHARLAVELV